MSIGKKLRVLNIVIVGLIVGLFVLIGLTSFNQYLLNNSQEVRYKSFIAANQLRFDSAELTRTARTYVITGNDKYETEYWHILDVQNGKAPWKNGKTIALMTQMEDLGFTETEFDLLKKAKQLSTDLITTETIAMNAVKGLYDDGKGNYTKKADPDPKMAARIMHDKKYHSDATSIMAPIDDFNKLLDGRTEGAVDGFSLISNSLLGAIGVVTLLIGVLVLMFFRGVKNELTRVVDDLVENSEQVGEAGRQIANSSSTLGIVTLTEHTRKEAPSACNQATALADSHSLNASVRNRFKMGLLSKWRWTLNVL